MDAVTYSTKGSIMHEYKDLDDLIERLDKIKEEGNGPLSLPKVAYLLVKEIKEIKASLSEVRRIQMRGEL